MASLLSSLNSVKLSLLSPPSSVIECVRNAAKKAKTSTRIKPGHPRPKHRGWKVQDGRVVTAGSILATQLTPRFHPGLHVGFGKNGTLFALEKGRVMVTCEKVNLNWDHTWIQRCYNGRAGQEIYKKHFNIIPEKHHTSFRLVDVV